jgi:nitrogen fixation/metabolism regulation signal transduction histidine kinase
LKPIQYEINSAEKIFDETYIIEGNIKEVIISGDESDLKVMLHNLEDNAIKHGFKNQSIMINKIEIVCEIDHASMTLRLKFSNSGNKLPKDFSKQDFIRNGVTSDITKGNGDGGSLIDKIINNHKGEFNISDLSKDDPDNDYVTSFIVQLPIKDIVSNN